MSNLWLNIRLAYWHLQIGPDRPWVAIKFNQYRWREGNRHPLFEVH